jgi:hypothetical protein
MGRVPGVSINRFIMIAILYFSVAISILYSGLNRAPFRESANNALPAPVQQQQQCVPAADHNSAHSSGHAK